MKAKHDTILTITLSAQGAGTEGTIVARRGDLASVLTFDCTLRSAIEAAIDCALVTLEEVQLNPPPAFPEPEAKKAETPAPKKAPAKKTPVKKDEPKKQPAKKAEKPKLDAAPATAPAPVVETKPAPVAEKPAEPAKPQLEQLTLF